MLQAFVYLFWLFFDHVTICGIFKSKCFFLTL